MIRIFTLATLALAAPLLISSPLQAAKIAPELQVEVIIFSQQDFYKNEQPRRDIKLNFPANYLLLTDPKLEKQRQIENQTNCPEQVTEAKSLVDSALESNLLPELIEPQIEPSYVLLNKSERQLNPDAYSLKRAPGYRVLFHEAWRQTKLSAKQAPWILIRGGRQTGEHFELEGAIRLYQSRHPHFQANIWKTSWKTASQIVQQVEEGVALNVEPWPMPPAFPQPSEKPPEEQPLTSNCAAGLTKETTEIEQVPETLLSEPEALLAELSVAPLYQVENLNSLNQSSRVHYKNVTYLDHPNLGVLIKLSSYQPAVAEITPAADADTPITTP